MAKDATAKTMSPVTILILLLLIPVGAFFGLKIYALDEWDTKIATLESKRESLDRELAQAENFEAKRAEKELLYRNLLAELETKKKILPKDKETAELINKLERIAKSSREVKIKIFRPEAPIQKDFYYEWPITIQCESGYDALGVFFEQISNFDRIFNVRDLNMKSLKRGSSDRPTIDSKFIASTFVYTGESTEKVAK